MLLLIKNVVSETILLSNFQLKLKFQNFILSNSKCINYLILLYFRFSLFYERKQVKCQHFTLFIMGACQCLFGSELNSHQVVTAHSLDSSTHSYTLLCTRITCLQLWVHNFRNICGGKNIWQHYKWWVSGVSNLIFFFQNFRINYIFKQSIFNVFIKYIFIFS